MMIFIDGVDRSGKDSALAELNKLTNYRHFVSSRSPISVYVYGLKFGRTVDVDYLRTLANNDVLFVTLYASEEELKRRCEATNEPPYSINADLQLFDKSTDDLTSKYGIHTTKICTTTIPPHIVARFIEAEACKINNTEAQLMGETVWKL